MLHFFHIFRLKVLSGIFWKIKKTLLVSIIMNISQFYSDFEYTFRIISGILMEILSLEFKFLSCQKWNKTHVEGDIFYGGICNLSAMILKVGLCSKGDFEDLHFVLALLILFMCTLKLHTCSKCFQYYFYQVNRAFEVPERVLNKNYIT